MSVMSYSLQNILWFINDLVSLLTLINNYKCAMADRRRRHGRRDSPAERSTYRRDRRSSPRAERDDGSRNRRRSRSPHGRLVLINWKVLDPWA